MSVRSVSNGFSVPWISTRTAERVVLVALAVLAANVEKVWFCTSFISGSVIGMHKHIESLDRLESRHFISFPQGFFQSLTGVVVPRPLTLVLNTVVAAGYIFSWPHITVPVVGATVGYALGARYLAVDPELASINGRPQTVRKPTDSGGESLGKEI